MGHGARPVDEVVTGVGIGCDGSDGPVGIVAFAYGVSSRAGAYGKDVFFDGEIGRDVAVLRHGYGGG